jgi:hypothetical protein
MTLLSLRSLYLDYNRFNGSLSQLWPSLGSGQVEQLILNDNQLTGEVPSRYDNQTHLKALEIQNNAFSKMNKVLCKQIVFEGGALVVWQADCDVCQCNYFCGEGQCYA